MSWIDDAGHGGRDPGTSANGLVEKSLTLEAATYVNKRLKDHGIKSDMSRTSDVTLDETPRVNKVKQYKYCISHHYNAGGGNGVELIRSIYSDGKFENDIIAEFRKKGYPVRPTPVFTRKGSNGQDYYFMHRRTGACRTTIVEYDFLDGPNANKLKDKKYREGMYECVVRAVCKQEKVKYKPLAQPALKKEDVQPVKKDDIKGHWAETSLKKAMDKKIIVGYSDGTTKPNEPVTRAQLAVILDRLNLLN